MKNFPASPVIAQDNDEIDLGRLAAVIWAGKIWIAFTMVLGLCAGLLYLANTPPTYQADALLQLEERGSQLALPEAMQDLMQDDPLAITEMEILRSRMVISQVVDELNLDWQAAPVLLPVFEHALTRYDLPLPETEFLKPYARSAERIGLDFLEVPPAWVGESIDLTISGNGAFEIMTPDGAVHNGRVEDTLVLENQGFTLRVADLEGAPGRRFVIRQISKNAAIGQLRGGLSVSERGRQSGVLEVRYTSHDREKAQRVLSAILEVYVQQNVSRRAAEANSSLEFIEGQLPGAERTLLDAERALTSFRQDRQSVLPEVANEVLNLTRKLELARSAYTDLLARAQELRVVSASSVGNVRIVDTAQASGVPVAPRGSRVLALSLLLGGMAGLALVFLRNWMRRGIDGAGDLEQLGLPVLATINYAPRIKHRQTRKGKAPILALDDPDDLTVEGVRSLRTGLHFSMLDARTRTLAITSPAPAAGKSFVSTNLAIVSAQAGQTVCLVDADLRRGQLHRYAGIPRESLGLADVLAGKISWEEALHEGPVPGLYIMPTGQLPPNPSELLMRHTLSELTQSLSGRFDLSILDCAPVLAVTDPVIVARAAGATVAVVRHGVTPPGEVIALQKAMNAAGIRLSGAILNAFDPRKVEAGYSYNYNYSYRYSYTKRKM